MLPSKRRNSCGFQIPEPSEDRLFRKHSERHQVLNHAGIDSLRTRWHRMYGRCRKVSQIQNAILLVAVFIWLNGCGGSSAPEEQTPGVQYAEALPEASKTDSQSSTTGANEVASAEPAKTDATGEDGVNSAATPGPVGPSPPPGSSLDALTTGDFADAAFEGNLRLVQKGISQGIDINVPNEDGNTALMLAAFNGHAEVVRLLISRDADVQAKNSVKRTALMFAATAPDNTATVEALLKAGANVNAVDGGEGYTALMFAAGEGHLAMAKLLLDAGADASIKDLDNETAAIHAANNGHTELARLLSTASQKKNPPSKVN